MNPRKNDVLASTLLFTALAISVVERLFWLFFSYWQLHYLPGPLGGKGAFVWLLEVMAQVIVYRAVRRGTWQAKITVVVGFLLIAYLNTILPQGYVAGVAFRDVWGWPLLALLKVLLALTALVLMFTKPRTESAQAGSSRP